MRPLHGPFIILCKQQRATIKSRRLGRRADRAVEAVKRLIKQGLRRHQPRQPHQRVPHVEERIQALAEKIILVA
ncbi:hypothetical protein MesoLj131c_68040 (plasmid) [Mesorhizobium sp. 131-3-5]|nr:hypothetical protein MesoLj131c_68040 [Mesorhizobium sp. 131-3-5]